MSGKSITLNPNSSAMMSKPKERKKFEIMNNSNQLSPKKKRTSNFMFGKKSSKEIQTDPITEDFSKEGIVLNKCQRCNLLERRLEDFESNIKKSVEISIQKPDENDKSKDKDIKEEKSVSDADNVEIGTQTKEVIMKDASTNLLDDILPFFRSYVSEIHTPAQESATPNSESKKVLSLI